MADEPKELQPQVFKSLQKKWPLPTPKEGEEYEALAEVKHLLAICYEGDPDKTKHVLVVGYDDSSTKWKVKFLDKDGVPEEHTHLYPHENIYEAAPDNLLDLFKNVLPKHKEYAKGASTTMREDFHAAESVKFYDELTVHYQNKAEAAKADYNKKFDLSTQWCTKASGSSFILQAIRRTLKNINRVPKSGIPKMERGEASNKNPLNMAQSVVVERMTDESLPTLLRWLMVFGLMLCTGQRHPGHQKAQQDFRKMKDDIHKRRLDDVAKEFGLHDRITTLGASAILLHHFLHFANAVDLASHKDFQDKLKADKLRIQAKGKDEVGPCEFCLTEDADGKIVFKIHSEKNLAQLGTTVATICYEIPEDDEEAEATDSDTGRQAADGLDTAQVEQLSVLGSLFMGPIAEEKEEEEEQQQPSTSGGSGTVGGGGSVGGGDSSLVGGGGPSLVGGGASSFGAGSVGAGASSFLGSVGGGAASLPTWGVPTAASLPAATIRPTDETQYQKKGGVGSAKYRRKRAESDDESSTGSYGVSQFKTRKRFKTG